MRRRLHELKITSDVAGQANDIFLAVPQVKLDFENPAVSLAAKHRVIDKVFPAAIRDFLKPLCDNDDVECMGPVLWRPIPVPLRKKGRVLRWFCHM